jgi:hypothetical protein
VGSLPDFVCLPPLNVGLVCQVGPPCKCDVGWDLLCTFSALSACFLLILDLNSEMAKYANTSVQQG